MPSSSVTCKQAEKVLEDVLGTLRHELENPNSVLCETDRMTFVKEEASLRERLKETVESEESSCWRDLFRKPSPQAAKCLKDAEELLERVKEDIYAKVRTRLTGESNPPSSSQGQGLAVDFVGTRTPADGNPEPASTMITSPLNMRCSLAEFSELNINPVAIQEDDHYRSDLNEAINTPLEMSSDQSSDSSTNRRQRRSPPLPPSSRRIAQSSLLLENTDDLGTGSSRGSHPSRRPAPPPPQSRISRSSMNISPNHLLLQPTGNTGSNSPHRSHSVRRPAPPPPQTRTPQTTDSSGSSSLRRSQSLRRPAPSPPQSGTSRSSIHAAFPSPNPLPFGPALFSSITELTEHVNSLASSVVAESSRQAHGRRGQRHSDGFVTKTNCVDINGSNVDGLTLNNGGNNNSGAVIHKTVLPHRSLQPVSQF